jgi:phosphoserine phosphatase RsbU/P
MLAVPPPPLPLMPDSRGRVLLADDSRAQRRVLASALARWGYAVEEAASGLEALEAARARPFDFVLSDWMMPGMDGPALCRAFRALPRDGYGYFILLTAKNDREEVARGLEAGADDFLAKPVNLAELQARMLAGGRIVAMQRELTLRHAETQAALQALTALNAAMDRDLEEARKLQMTLVRERQRDFGAVRVSVMLQPSGHVGGDLVGYFPMPPGRVGVYAVDVAGHGVTSAIMAARLAGMLAGAEPDGNVMAAGVADALPPEQVAARLNAAMLEGMQVETYFTCVYAQADLLTGRVDLVQAGHPHPLILRAGGRVERVGDGGLPIGLIPGAAWDRVTLWLQPGDRLLLMSDGMTEAADPHGAELGEDGLARLVARHAAIRGHDFLQALLWGIEAWTGEADISDDVSAVLLEWAGASP